MTNAEALEFCRQAYRSLVSFHGKVSTVTRGQVRRDIVLPVSGDSIVPPNQETYRSASEIWYVRPNLIRVEGHMDQFEWEPDVHRYELVSDGTNAWHRDDLVFRDWRKEPGPAIAMGFPMQKIPLLLFEDSIYWAVCEHDSEAELVREEDRDLWRVHSTTDIGEITYHVDSDTGLLVRMREAIDLARVLDRDEARRKWLARPFMATMSTIWDDDEWDYPDVLVALEYCEEFGVISCNEELPPSLFQRPEGAPE